MTIIFQNLNTIKKEKYQYNYNYIIIIVIELIAMRAVEVVTRDSGGAGGRDLYRQAAQSGVG
jgi:hypothetical protein